MSILKGFDSGKWQSQFRIMTVNYNQNVWTLIHDSYDDKSGSLFGVIDKKDGSSFAIDFTVIADNDEYMYDLIESEYFSRIFNVDNRVKEIERLNIIIDTIFFKCISYSYLNKKYGQQALMRGMYIGESEVIGVSLAWPENLQLPEKNSFPPKFDIFFQNFVLRTKHNVV